MENAGVYDPQSIGGTHVIYVLHDATDPERYGGLPKNPTIPWSYTIWKWLFKPVRFQETSPKQRDFITKPGNCQPQGGPKQRPPAIPR